MLFTNDIVLIDEIHVGVNDKRGNERDTSISKGFRLSKSEKEGVDCGMHVQLQYGVIRNCSGNQYSNCTKGHF